MEEWKKGWDALVFQCFDIGERLSSKPSEAWTSEDAKDFAFAQRVVGLDHAARASGVDAVEVSGLRQDH